MQEFRQAIHEQDREVVEGVYSFWNGRRPRLRRLADRPEAELPGGVAARGGLAVAGELVNDAVADPIKFVVSVR